MPGMFSDSVGWLMFETHEFKGFTVAADRGSPKVRCFLYWESKDSKQVSVLR